MRVDRTPWLLVLTLPACGPRVGDSPCDPLAAEVTEEAIEDLVGVGRDGQGVLYVIDRPGFEARVYVSEGGALVRHRVLGSGETSAGGAITLTLIVDAEPRDFALGHEDRAGAARMAIAHGLDEARTFEEILAGGEALEVLTEQAIAGMPARFTREVELEYHARIAADQEVVVVRPRDDWDYEDFRLFLGPPEGLAERRVYEVVRFSDGGSTTITFDHPDGRAALDFPYRNLEPDQATLTVDGRTRDVEWLDAAAFVAQDHGFLCF